MHQLALTIVLLPLVAAIIAGLFGRIIGRAGTHWITISAVGISFFLSALLFKNIIIDGVPSYDAVLYTWLVSDGIDFSIGFLIDELTATMMVVVTFVSWMVHIYTVGYMQDDPGYQRFFSYISLFTFAMLMLVMANNFLQLFFGWEAVGVISYLLIGFWFKRDTAIYANLKAFLVNRVGDFGFLLGIAAVLATFGSLDYATVFVAASEYQHDSIEIFRGSSWSLMSVICILLFIGAMGKSAQVPLHVWLPDSMEGPTPISALIHAATMVTAGIFMVARMSPLFEYSEVALSFVLVVGATTAFFMGLLGLVQNDIKRVVAYSTLSQLGYMTVALGVSAYGIAIFHLITHAFFKALLFLGAGSVIIAMHHEQDMQRMGGLHRYMRITWLTALIGSLALIGFPGTSGFFSKDAIIEAVHSSNIPGAHYAYLAVLSGVFVTALYTFRMFFMTFHGDSRIDSNTRKHLRESPVVITVPLILLAIPSLIVGAIAAGPILGGTHFGESIMVLPSHQQENGFHGVRAMVTHGLFAAPTLLALLGVATAWVLYQWRPGLPVVFSEKAALVYRILLRKYGFDAFNEFVFVGGARALGTAFWRLGDIAVIDGILVDGTARLIGWTSSVARRVQSGYLYHYAFAMILGLLGLLAYFVHGWIG